MKLTEAKGKGPTTKVDVMTYLKACSKKIRDSSTNFGFK